MRRTPALLNGSQNELLRNPISRSSVDEVLIETVWKIAKGVLAVLIAVKEMADRDSFDPSWPLSEPRFGTHPDFPNSFSTHSGDI
jgi:hypothetical protein